MEEERGASSKKRERDCNLSHLITAPGLLPILYEVLDDTLGIAVLYSGITESLIKGYSEYKGHGTVSQMSTALCLVVVFYLQERTTYSLVRARMTGIMM